jgi:hypothetical protein
MKIAKNSSFLKNNFCLQERENNGKGWRYFLVQNILA